MRQGRPVTADRANFLDWLKRLEPLGVKPADAKRLSADLSAQWKTPPSNRDVIWGLLNAGVSNVTTREDLSALYWFQGEFLFEEGKPSFREPMARMHALAFQGWREDAADGLDLTRARVVVIASSDACPACIDLNGRLMSLEEAERLAILPAQHCTHVRDGRPGWCRCTYGLSFAES